MSVNEMKMKFYLKREVFEGDVFFLFYDCMAF